ncbi:hypothetical protein [Rufibacter sp. LB8]|uniref:hypothetical protein n=1 Tax=Rufibacter sp. LB8 TaxID=2777781 RepID=UPI00178C7B24|nr:hypothetical protein [Rufibacter sp. LB8]
MKKIFLLIVVVAIAAGGYWFYNRAKTGPEASILHIKTALEANDMQALEKYVDLKRTSQSLVDGSKNMVMDQLPEGLRGAATLLGKGLALKRDLNGAVRNQLKQTLESASGQKVPDMTDVIKVLPFGKLLNKNMLPKLEFQDIDYVNREDSIAVVGLKVRPVNQTESMVIELLMEDRGDYWQVVGIPNFSTVLPQLITIGRKKE